MSWEVFPDAESIAQAALQRILAAAAQAISRKGSFSLVLAGGRTPRRVYSLLAEQRQDWFAWQFYFGDERCLPVDHPERNSVMATETLFSRLPLQAEQIHVIRAEQGAVKAALLYEREITPVLPFDLVILGLGEDGHTASLFPGHEHPQDRLVAPVHDAPKPPPERVSLNYPVLAGAHGRLFLVNGEDKREAVGKWRRGEDIPAACLPESDILVDRAAWNE